MLGEPTARLGPPEEATPARYLVAGEETRYEDDRITAETLDTENPTAATLEYEPMPDAEQETQAVIDRLLAYGRQQANEVELDLEGALGYAIKHSREFKFAEEEYVLAALRLLVEEHRWGPRFFDEVRADISAFGDGGTFDSTLRVVNDFSVTQRLPYGGDVSARLLATAVEDLHQRVAGENIQTAELIFDADVPLLRGAGTVAREDLIQARARHHLRGPRVRAVPPHVPRLDRRGLPAARRRPAQHRQHADAGRGADPEREPGGDDVP